MTESHNIHSILQVALSRDPDARRALTQLAIVVARQQRAIESLQARFIAPPDQAFTLTKGPAIMKTQDARSTAIVLAADSAVDQWMKDKAKTRVVTTPQQKVNNWGGYARGKEFGNSVNLAPKAVSTTGDAAKALAQ